MPDPEAAMDELVETMISFFGLSKKIASIMNQYNIPPDIFLNELFRRVEVKAKQQNIEPEKVEIFKRSFEYGMNDQLARMKG